MHASSPVISAAQTPFTRHRRFDVEWFVLVAVQLVVATTMTVDLVREERSTRHAEHVQLESRAKIVDENLSQQLEGADRALLGVADGIAELNEAADAAPITKQLKLLTAAMPGFSSMLWLGPDGTVRASSNDILIGKNFAQREYFAAPLRVGDPVRLYVSPPFLSSLGTYVIVVSRLLIDSQGAFGGVVTATLDPKYFSVLLRSVLHAPDMRAALVHGDGAVFLELPGETTIPGAQPPELAALVAAHRQQTNGRTSNDEGTSIGGSLRLVELRTLDRDEPLHEQKLLVMLSRDLPVVLASWRVQATRDVALLLVLVLISSGSLWLDQRRRRAAHATSAAAQRDLQSAADRVDQALRGADLGLWELHVPTETFVINDRERALLGYLPDNDLPQGPAWRRLIHPDDRTQVDRAIVPHLEGRAPAYEIEHRMLHRSGHYVWVFSRAMIVERGPKGEPIRIVGTHLDVTDRKNAEIKQALNERRLKAINDNVPAIVAHLDLAQCYLTANEEFRRIFGIDPATMLGRTLRAVRGEAVYAQMAPHVTATLGGETRRFELTDTIDGIQHYFQHSFVPDIDEAGAVQGFYSVSFDISELRRSQALLVESSARHRAIVEEQSELVSLAREDGELIYVNHAHAKHFGRPAVALVGESLFDLVTPVDRAMARASIAAVFATGQAHSGDSRVISADGAERWVAWTASLQRDSRGALLLRSVGRDITEQRRAERALRASQRFLLQTGRVAGVGGWEVDLVRNTLNWSEQVRRIHDVTDDYLPTLEGAIAFYAPEARPVIQAAVQTAIDTGQSWDLELRMRTATGRFIWVRASGDVEFQAGKAVRLVGALQDITRRKLAEQAVEQKERLLRTVTDNLPVFIMYVDNQETVRFLNATGEAWLDRASGAGINRPLVEVLGPTRYEARRSQVQRALAGENVQFEIETDVGGKVRHLQQIYTPDVQPDGNTAGLFVLISDITAAKETQRQFEELARVDALTGLPNRRQFDERFEQALQRSHRSAQHVAVMYLDIDHFKAINDSVGHAGGDAVLKEFGSRLKACVRETDLAARLAGDEFVVLLEGLTIEDDAGFVAQKIVDAMRVEFEVEGTSLRVTTSLGIGFSSDVASTAAELMACADRALYEAKRAGRDGFRSSNLGVLTPAPSQLLKSSGF